MVGMPSSAPTRRPASREILEAFADRATIEQDFHDVKEVWGSGQQQVRNIWTNVAVYNSESVDAYAGGTVGLEPTRHATWSIAATRRGTTPSAALRTPIVAKPCGN